MKIPASPRGSSRFGVEGPVSLARVHMASHGVSRSHLGRMDRVRTPMPCVFCGATDRKMSNEHLWPDWVRRLLPPGAQKDVVTYNFDTHDRGRVRSFSTTIFDLRVKDVCRPCNQGWMSRYETNVQAWVTGMLRGRGRHLHRTGQTVLAAWAVLKCLVGQRTFADQTLIPEHHYGEVYALRDEARPPNGAQVFTARAAWSEGDAPPGFFRVNGLALLPPEQAVEAGRLDGYVATLSVLDLVVQVFWPYDSRPGVLSHQPGYVRSLHRIWPVSESFVWPPGPSLTGVGIAGISGPEPKPT
jgi:hypothetical protein